jgi:hypothetical protein
VAIGATLAALAVLAGIGPVARQQPDVYAGSRAFVASAEPRRIILYRPQNKSEASFFSGLGYHLLGDDVLARLSTLHVHEEVASGLPDGRDADLLVVHANAPGEPRFGIYKAQLDRRLAGTAWKPAYADPVAAAYLWKEGLQ